MLSQHTSIVYPIMSLHLLYVSALVVRPAALIHCISTQHRSRIVVELYIATMETASYETVEVNFVTRSAT